MHVPASSPAAREQHDHPLPGSTPLPQLLPITGKSTNGILNTTTHEQLERPKLNTHNSTSNSRRLAIHHERIGDTLSLPVLSLQSHSSGGGTAILGQHAAGIEQPNTPTELQIALIFTKQLCRIVARSGPTCTTHTNCSSSNEKLDTKADSAGNGSNKSIVPFNARKFPTSTGLGTGGKPTKHSRSGDGANHLDGGMTHTNLSRKCRRTNSNSYTTKHMQGITKHKVLCMVTNTTICGESMSSSCNELGYDPRSRRELNNATNLTHEDSSMDR
ncbi:hypothetical protein A4A49_19960 [Nicotiana attenuata]|uniref:Uncharacterized protein n=1 Tax=Nicotiana attenuata TaxID=49451 RepID=A0A1J6IXK2_NICAT|nr:hypothetical protein A4A49_19960 [Nicotiana attenuata]